MVHANLVLSVCNIHADFESALLSTVPADNTCVRPLYAHMFVPSVGPSLALCGLPWRSAKHPQFQLQGQLLARLLSGRARLPSQQEMQQVRPG